MRAVNICATLFCLVLLISERDGSPDDVLAPLKSKCFDTSHVPGWWSYIWCFRDSVEQLHYDSSRDVIEANKLIGNYIGEESQSQKEVYRRKIADCQSAPGTYVPRRADVTISCCRDEKWSAMHDRFRENSVFGTFIESVTEPSPCVYMLRVCSDLICSTISNPRVLAETTSRLLKTRGCDKSLDDEDGRDDTTAPSQHGFVDFIVDQIDYISDKGSIKGDAYLSEASQLLQLDRVRNIFIHGYDMYMEHAQPQSELRPLSCDGGQFELVKIPLVTLIDTLDTLVIMGNYSEFRNAVGIVREHFRLKAFDVDENVSVFETTIRVLGGLLSAHLMAVDPRLGIYNIDYSENLSDYYDNELLQLAHDLGERLLPAFSTPTGIPYGTVNLRHGVPSGETAIASTAGAGSLLMEFEVLSSLVGDVRFGDAAFTAAQALYNRRSYLGLLGKHIHTGTGHWHETASGVGSNADSFYEYLLKGHLLFHRPGLFVMFADTYEAVKKIVQVGDWFTEVDMFNGKSRRNRVENLQAFWPGMESIIGLCNSAARLLNNFYAVWDDIGFLPEEFDQAAWLSNQVINNSWYPLRPELIESTYFHYRSTADRSWLTAGSLFLDNIEANTRTECGHASISNIGSMELTNSMPSYFLSETCKYLYLLFDDDNFVHERAYMFSTEAHPFDPMQLPVRLQNADIASEVSEIVQPAAGSKILLPLKCPKNLWWDSSIVAYNSDHVRNQLADIVRTPEEELVVEDSLAARRSVTALNSDRIAQLLRQPTPQDVSNVNLHGSQSDLKMNVCYEDEGVDLLPTSQAQQAIIAKDPSPQKMSVDAGVLGVFDVSIYTDGFVVHSQRHGDTLGITNIGERLVFITHVSASPDLHSKTHTGEHSGKINTCTVSVVDANGEILDGDRERSCSLATFSTASIVFSPIIAELHIPPKVNRMACKPLNLRPKSKTAVKEKSWWAQWPSASKLSSLLSRPRSKSINAGPLGSSVSSSNRAKVVFAPRGDCLFEDKTLLAQEAGAIGVIIANSEDSLFAMSGKEQSGLGGKTEHKLDIQSTEEAELLSVDEIKIEIPTVMITKSDAESLLSTLASSSADGTQVRIDLTSYPSMLDTTYMGSESYPKLRVGRQVVHAVGDGQWGIASSSVNGREWQLYIMSAADTITMMFSFPLPAVTSGNQKVSTTFAASIDPLEIYHGMISRQCPTHIELDGDHVVIIKPTPEQ